MIVSIIGCGQSAKEWFNTPCDLSIGVNDCFKFGRDADWLVVVNAIDKFTPKSSNNYTDRLATIVSSKPKRFLCHNGAWKRLFLGAELLELHPFRGSLRKGRIAFKKTSPFVALHVAFNAGASDIILWGVDFTNHPKINGKVLIDELVYYRALFDLLKKEGVNVWIGNDQTVLKEYLPVYKPISSNTIDMTT